MVPDLKLHEFNGETGVGCNPLVDIQIALAGKVADIIKLRYAQSTPKKACADTT